MSITVHVAHTGTHTQKSRHPHRHTHSTLKARTQAQGLHNRHEITLCECLGEAYLSPSRSLTARGFSLGMGVRWCWATRCDS